MKLFIVVVAEFTTNASVVDSATIEKVTSEYVEVASAGSIVSVLDIFTVFVSLAIAPPAINFTF